MIKGIISFGNAQNNQEILTTILRRRIYSSKELSYMKKNSDGTPKSGLSRTLNTDEVDMAMRIPAAKMQIYIDLLDDGVNGNDANLIAKSTEKTNLYRTLVQKDENDKPKSGASRVLTPQEAAFYITKGNHVLTPTRLQYFIDLLDEGVGMTDAKNLLIRKSIHDKYIKLAHPDENGNPQTDASRVMTPDEAVKFIHSNASVSKAKTFVELIDNGMDINNACFYSKMKASAEIFLLFVQPNEDGSSKAGLSRIMTPDEAIYAIANRYNPQKLINDIDSKKIVIKRPMKLNVIS